MLRTYLPAIVFLVLGIGIGVVFASLNMLLGPRRAPRSAAKSDPYECGLPSDVKKNFKFGISFYLVAILFILFDLEVILIVPAALQLKAYGTFALGAIAIFIVLLLVGFIYEWRRGALEWK